jgi:arylsulfatase
MYTYNYLGLKHFVATGNSKLPTGKSTVKLDFAYAGGKPGAGGTATLYINGKSVGSAKVEQTEFAVFSADESAGVGIDMETPVSQEYDRAGSRFTGTIDKVTINLKK